MKHRIKVVFIVFTTIIVLMLGSIAVLLYAVQNEAFLTSRVEKILKEQIAAKVSIQTVDLDVTSAFPEATINIKNFSLQSPENYDTLIAFEDLKVGINLFQFLWDNDLFLLPCSLKNGVVNYTIDREGKSVFEKTFASSDVASDTISSAEFPFKACSFSNIVIQNVRFNYSDKQQHLNCNILLDSCFFEGYYRGDSLLLKTAIERSNMKLSINDSVPSTLILHNSKIETFFHKNVEESNCHLFVKSFIPDVTYHNGNDTYIQNKSFKLHLPLTIALKNHKLSLLNFQNPDLLKIIKVDKAQIQLEDFEVNVQGKILPIYNDSNWKSKVDLQVKTNEWDLNKFSSFIPISLKKLLPKFSLGGSLKSEIILAGVFSNDSMPELTSTFSVHEGTLDMPTLCPPFKRIDGEITFLWNFNVEGKNKILIPQLNFYTSKSSLKLSGAVEDLLNKMSTDLHLKSSVYLEEFQKIIPADFPLKMKGKIDVTTFFKGSLAEASEQRFNALFFKTNVITKEASLNYNDSVKTLFNNAHLTFDKPSYSKENNWINIHLQSDHTKVEQVGMMTTQLDSLNMDLFSKQQIKAESIPKVEFKIQSKILTSIVDSLFLQLKSPKVTGIVNHVSKEFKKGQLTLDIVHDAFSLKENKEEWIKTGILNAQAKLNYDENSGTELIEQCHPKITIKTKDLAVNLNDSTAMNMSLFDGEINSDICHILNSQLTFLGSDLNIKGTISNIWKYATEQEILKGEIQLYSKHTDVGAMMDFFNGMGVEDSLMTSSIEQKTIHKKDSLGDPFIVPKGINFYFDTHIDDASFYGNQFQNVNGGLTINDGNILVEQMGLTNKAAEMRLTGLYRSPRRNNLFVSCDFHLLKIKLDELIKLMPDVERMLPMLKAFKGTGEFHFGIQTNLDSYYNIKQSSLLGAASIEGHDLTLMDNDTFNSIAQKLHFKKGQQNKIDHMYVEMTVFQDEVELFPFLLELSNYKAVISGIHSIKNLSVDNKFNYHISVTDCPLPIRLGLNISGTTNDLHYKLAKCKYKNLFNPKKQGVVEKQTLEFKEIIRNSLKKSLLKK